jgi:tetratricopeptide (TPR) repeat protein
MQADSAIERDRSTAAVKRPGLLAPVVILSLFAVTLPASMARPSSGVSKEDCLVLAERQGPSAPLALIEQCSALYPRDVELLADLGRGYETAEPARAEATYVQALAVDPGYADLRLRLARLLLRRGAANDAITEAQGALRLQPNRRAIVEFLAEARQAAKTP